MTRIFTSISTTAFVKLHSVKLAAKMEILSDLLAPHKDIIGTAASAAAYFHQFSGVIMCYTIYRQKSTIGQSLMPFLFGATM